MFIVAIFIAIFVILVSNSTRIHKTHLQNMRVDAWIQYLESRVSKIENMPIYSTEPLIEPVAEYRKLATEFIQMFQF
jgi:hypothetical protein